jgi:hypothetical protein
VCSTMVGVLLSLVSMETTGAALVPIGVPDLDLQSTNNLQLQFILTPPFVHKIYIHQPIVY